MHALFRKFAHWTSQIAGTPLAFVFAIMLIFAWAISGPVFGFSDTWQLIINTGTTILTFLMVFLIQNTQNRDARAVHLKLDELIRTVRNAREDLIDVENDTDEKLALLEHEFENLRLQNAAVAGRKQGRKAGRAARATD